MVLARRSAKLLVHTRVGLFQPSRVASVEWPRVWLWRRLKQHALDNELSSPRRTYARSRGHVDNVMPFHLYSCASSYSRRAGGPKPKPLSSPHTNTRHLPPLLDPGGKHVAMYAAELDFPIIVN